MKEVIKNGFDSIPQLENDGTVHHLGLTSNDIGEACILTSNLERVEIIKDEFKDAKKVGQRRNMLNYLAKKDVTRYREIVSKLGLRK